MSCLLPLLSRNGKGLPFFFIHLDASSCGRTPTTDTIHERLEKHPPMGVVRHDVIRVRTEAHVHCRSDRLRFIHPMLVL